jgi:hypothetical protein
MQFAPSSFASKGSATRRINDQWQSLDQPDIRMLFHRRRQTWPTLVMCLEVVEVAEAAAALH